MNNKVKSINKSIIRVFFALIILVLIISPIKYSATNLKHIDYDITLNDDGSATIKEERLIYPTDGTEQYISFTKMHDMEMKNISISDSSGLNYEYVENWNVNASMDEKHGKFGIVDVSGGFELCFGINEYDEKTYYLEYTLTNFIKSYPDYDGVNYQFFEKGGLTPDNILITMKKENQELLAVDENGENGNTAVWAFGYEGYIEVVDNIITAQSEGRINYFTTLLRFDKGIFTPTSVGRGTFEELKNVALNDSEYEESENSSSNIFPVNIFPVNIFPVLIMLITMGTLIVSPILLMIANTPKYIDVDGKKRKIKINKDEINYSRDIPFNGNIPPTKFIVEKFYKTLKIRNVQEVSGAWFSTYLLRLLEKNIISIQGETQKKSVIIINNYGGTNLDVFEKEILNILISAMEDKQVLSQKDLKKWSYRNYQHVGLLNKKIIADGEQYLRATNNYTGKRSAFTLAGVKEVEKIHGFKKFLEDFTIINERSPIDVVLWGDYLVFATLFGMSEELAKIYNNINPDYFNSNFGYNYRTYLFINAFSRSYNTGYSNATTAASGGGGSSSFSGGGGGSSGGGSTGTR